MSLTTCPDCGRGVSTSAPTCPGCGRRLKRERKSVGCCGGCLVLLVAGWLVIQLGTCGLFYGLSEAGTEVDSVEVTP